MTPIEAAARALAKHRSGVDDFDELDKSVQETLKAEARAVLAATREPSDTMLDAAHGNEHADWDAGWRAMIDAALGEG
ncbi:hypothetical protein [Croceibacterium ferulae]|uniref:hypothetical protein n=1 Tax=Croceibacterium ferulae TaxID=1854641 RepID=UPI000EB54D15|nr:hypothetical protein [Croceibacterium ferulae]